MAFELYGMLAGSVSTMTGEHVKPAYGGDKEAFLTKVITPIYNVIAKVTFMNSFFELLQAMFYVPVMHVCLMHLSV